MLALVVVGLDGSLVVETSKVLRVEVDGVAVVKSARVPELRVLVTVAHANNASTSVLVSL